MLMHCDKPCVTCAPPPPGTEGIFPNPNDPQNPFANLSSENPDVDLFIARRGCITSPFLCGGGGGTGPGPDHPPLNSIWKTNACDGLVTCFSTISQADADICAYNEQIKCDAKNWPDPTVPNICVIRPDLCPDPVPQDQPRPIYGNEPQQCSLACPDGSSFVANVGAGTFIAFSVFEANAIAKSYACQLASQQRICMGTLSQTKCCSENAYAGTIAVISAYQPLTFAITGGALPPGITLSNLNSNTALLSGSPESVGAFTFSLQVADALGNTMVKDYTLNVIGIVNNTDMPQANVGVAYSQTLLFSGPFTGTPVFSILSGVLPDGLSLNALTGEISGTPTTTQSVNFTVAVNIDGLLCTRQFNLTVEENSCPAQTATIATSSLVQSITSAKDAAVFRAMMTNINLPGPTFGFFLIDTSNNTILITSGLTTISGIGCYAVVAGQFCWRDDSFNIQIIDATGTPSLPVAATNPVTGNPAYNSTDDVVYFPSYDGANYVVVEFDANTNSINSETSIGAYPGAGFAWFCPTPKQLLVGSGFGTAPDVYSLPGLVLQGSLPGMAGGFAFGVTFATSTGKLYASAYDTVAPFNFFVYEINPTTLAIDFTYSLGETGGSCFLDYNPTNDRIYATTGNSLFTINPTDRSIVCSVPAVGCAPVSVDLASQSILVNDAAGQTLVFHH